MTCLWPRSLAYILSGRPATEPSGSGAVRKDSPWAPAMHHNRHSSPAATKALVTLGITPSKTHRFWRFHNVQALRIISKFSPLIYSSHHSEQNLFSPTTYQRICLKVVEQEHGVRLAEGEMYQKCLAKTHDTRIWLMVSSCWSHRGHCSGWGNPRRARQSVVQCLLCATSHKKKRHLTGALVFQIGS